jgi:predicted nucleotidyltransferase
MWAPGTIKRKLTPYFARRREVLLAYLFGSVAQGRTNKLSDVDMALLVDERKFKGIDAKEPYGYKAAVIADFMGLLHTNEIDLVLLHEATPLLAHEVIRTGTVIFCRDEDLRADCEIRTRYHYLDTKKIRQIQAHYLYKRIDAGLFGKIGVAYARNRR